MVWNTFPEVSNWSWITLVDLKGCVVKPVVFRPLEEVCYAIHISDENKNIVGSKTCQDYFLIYSSTHCIETKKRFLLMSSRAKNGLFGTTRRHKSYPTFLGSLNPPLFIWM